MTSDDMWVSNGQAFPVVLPGAEHMPGKGEDKQEVAATQTLVIGVGGGFGMQLS